MVDEPLKVMAQNHKGTQKIYSVSLFDAQKFSRLIILKNRIARSKL
jgi:hypothetical protein